MLNFSKSAQCSRHWTAVCPHFSKRKKVTIFVISMNDPSDNPSTDQQNWNRQQFFFPTMRAIKNSDTVVCFTWTVDVASSRLTKYTFSTNASVILSKNRALGEPRRWFLVWFERFQRNISFWWVGRLLQFNAD